MESLKFREVKFLESGERKVYVVYTPMVIDDEHYVMYSAVIDRPSQQTRQSNSFKTIRKFAYDNLKYPVLVKLDITKERDGGKNKIRRLLHAHGVRGTRKLVATPDSSDSSTSTSEDEPVGSPTLTGDTPTQTPTDDFRSIGTIVHRLLPGLSDLARIDAERVSQINDNEISMGLAAFIRGLTNA